MLSSSSLTPIHFFSAGNVVTAGLQLYRKQFSTFVRISFVAHAWFVLPLVLLFGSVFSFANADRLAALLFLIVPVSLALFVYGLAKYQALSAAISRLSYYELLQTPETPAQASRYVNQRIGGFLLIGFLLSLIYVAVAIALYILLAIVVSIVAIVTGIPTVFQQGVDPSDPMVIGGMIAVFSSVVLILSIPTLLLILWLIARFFIAEVTFAIEPETLAGSALTRSWALTRKSSWRVVLLLLVIFTVLFPLQSLIQVFSTLLQGVALAIDPEQFPGIYAIALTASYVLAFALSIFTLPLWQATKAVLYYDLRSRREGMGLELPDPAEPSLSDRSPQASPVLQFFRHVKLVTPESVELEFTLAGIGSRALALLVDYGIILIGGLLFWVVFGFFSYQLLRYLEQTAIGYSDLPLWLLAIGMLLSFLFTAGYFAGFEVLRQGQTPGKRWANIRVIRDDGRPVGLAQAVLRSLLQPIDFLLFLGAFLIVWGKREKRIGDWAAGTLVIQENRAGKQAIGLSDEAKRLSPELPTMTDLQQLQPTHFVVISEYLQRRSLLNPKARNNLSLNLARQIRTLIQLETIPQDLTADQFLEAVYLAYQAQFSAY
jgi:uncharacterized RDD family membrane protein YckC